MAGLFESQEAAFSAGGAFGGAVTTYTGIPNAVLAKLDVNNGAVLMGRMLARYVWACGVRHKATSARKPLGVAAYTTTCCGVRCGARGGGGGFAFVSYGTSDVMKHITGLPSDAARCADCSIITAMFRGDAAPPKYTLQSTRLGWSSDTVTLTSRGQWDM